MANEAMAKEGTAKAEGKQIVSTVLSQINEFKGFGDLKLPADYSFENAIRSAWLILQETTDKNGKLAIETCTNSSILNCLFNMAIQGLNPAKKQCYFIAYGNKLTLSVSYMGSIALAKRFAKVKDVKANLIYKDDDFDFEIDVDTGVVKVLKHKQAFANLSGEIVGAYANLTLEDGSHFVEIMTMSQIRKSWEQSPSKGNSPAHKNFPEEIAKRTVIQRACKLFINTSSDSALIEDDNDFETTDRASDQTKQTISKNANRGDVINMDEIINDVPEAPAPTPEPPKKPSSTAKKAEQQASEDEPAEDEPF